MEEKRSRVIVLIVIAFCVCLIILIALLCIQNDYDQESIARIDISEENEALTISDILNKYQSEFIKQDGKSIYSNLHKDLYDEEGRSNETFFDGIIEELGTCIHSNFNIIDENKNINIYVECNSEGKIIKFIINNIENFFKNTDGNSYSKVENVQIVEGVDYTIINRLLSKLELNRGSFSSIENELGEGKQLSTGYISYLNNTVRLRKGDNNVVINLIFGNGLKDDITNNINTEMTLKQINEVAPKNDFGSLEKRYLGYRYPAFYIFYYNDETSVYSYSYEKNFEFERILKEYVETKDLDRFVKSLTSKWKIYDSLDYNPNIKMFKASYSTRGVDINIENNNPKGITLYNNYCFTDLTKSYVKNGIISFNPNEDLIEKVEIQRREREN